MRAGARIIITDDAGGLPDHRLPERNRMAAAGAVVDDAEGVDDGEGEADDGQTMRNRPSRRQRRSGAPARRAV
jgi:hypothetical protein